MAEAYNAAEQQTQNERDRWERERYATDLKRPVGKMRMSAVIPSCQRYRYRLDRRWADGGKIFTYIMLNPSTADAEKDDPTIRKCIAFARREKASAIIVVNLFGWRATDPRELPEDNAIAEGPGNREHVLAACVAAISSGGEVICAWGAHRRARMQSRDILGMLSGWQVRLSCFGVTMDGYPKHPCYLALKTPIVPFAR